MLFKATYCKMCWLALAVAITGMLAPCAAMAQVSKTDLTLNIVYDNFGSLKAGEQRRVFLEVANNGDTEFTDIQLSAESPAGWTVEFSPAIIARLPANGVQTVDITFRSAENTYKGNYNIGIIAQAGELRRVASLYVRVESSSLLWVWVGMGIAILLIAGAAAIFWRFGRRRNNMPKRKKGGTMIERVHEHIISELGVNTRTDTIFVLTAIILNLITLAINSGIASSQATTTNTIVMFVILVLIIVVNFVAEMGLIRGRQMRRKLLTGLMKMYKDEGVEGYYDPSLLSDYRTRYNLFMLTVLVTGLIAIVIPFVIR